MATRVEKCATMIAGMVQARLNCQSSNNTEWFERHTMLLQQIARDILPSGAGIDCGTAINLNASTGERLVLHFSFHHMNGNGMYSGWTDYTVRVTASLIFGLDITITGQNRNDIKDYLYQTFEHVLSSDIEQIYDSTTETTTFHRLVKV